MPEGLSDQDRARIESARQSASGCLSVAGFVAFGFAVLVTLGGIGVMVYLGGDTTVVVAIGAVIAVCWLVGFGYLWISRQ